MLCKLDGFNGDLLMITRVQAGVEAICGEWRYPVKSGSIYKGVVATDAQSTWWGEFPSSELCLILRRRG